LNQYSRARYDEVDTRELSVSGTGPTILLLHPFGLNADVWRPLLSRLEHFRRTARAVDLVGFGHADGFQPGPLLPQLQRFVSAAVAAHSSAGPVVLVGNSLGALLALRVADTQPAAVQGIVAIGTPGTGWTTKMHLALSIRRLLHLATVSPAPTAMRIKASSLAFRLAISCRRDETTLGLQQALQDATRTRAAARHLLDTALTLVDEIAATRPITLQCPTVIVHGARDRLVSERAARTLHRTIPNSRLVLLPRSGHCAQLDEPHRIAALTCEVTTITYPGPVTAEEL
jgi:pimeloyl-ACP methyl ester carboxylesterase